MASVNSTEVTEIVRSSIWTVTSDEWEATSATAALNINRPTSITASLTSDVSTPSSEGSSPVLTSFTSQLEESSTDVITPTSVEHMTDVTSEYSNSGLSVSKTSEYLRSDIHMSQTQGVVPTVTIYPGVKEVTYTFQDSPMATTPSSDRQEEITNLQNQLADLQGAYDSFKTATIVLVIVLLVVLILACIYFIYKRRNKEKKHIFVGMDADIQDPVFTRHNTKFDSAERDMRLGGGRVSTASLGESDDETTALETFTSKSFDKSANNNFLNS